MAKSSQAKRLNRPTLQDVARVAGVSLTTVSFVINDVTNAGISEETRIRVNDAIAQLDYHPNEAARSLRSSATQILGLAAPEANNEHHQQTADGVETYARDQGYTVFRCITHFNVGEEQRCFQFLKQRRFDALILSLSTGGMLLDEIRTLRQQGYVITGLGFSLKDVATDNVHVEAESGEKQLIEHLVSLGHRRIGYIYGVADQHIFGERLNACLRVQRTLGIPIVEPWICRCGPLPEDSYRAVEQLLSRCSDEKSERPTALVVVNDLLSSAVLAALFAAGISVPAQMSVASFDNTPMSRYLLPPLTTVDCNAYAMGEHAARLTIERLALPQRPYEDVSTPARLIIRQSTGSAPRAY